MHGPETRQQGAQRGRDYCQDYGKLVNSISPQLKLNLFVKEMFGGYLNYNLIE